MVGRPFKKGIDYFPMDVNFFSDLTVKKIARACGPGSTSVLVCLLCNIYRDNGYYVLWDEDLPFVISNIVGISESAVKEVIKKALQVGFFDNAMYEEHKILTSSGIQKRFLNATSKRKQVEMISDYRINHADNSINVTDNSINGTDNSINGTDNSQSKVKERKEKESKEKEIKKESKEETAANAERFRPPSIEEARAYIQEKGYGVDAENFCNFYESKGWMVGKNKMKNWHAAVATWRRKDNEKRYGNISSDGRTEEERLAGSANLIDKLLNDQE